VAGCRASFFLSSEVEGAIGKEEEGEEEEEEEEEMAGALMSSKLAKRVLGTETPVMVQVF
jgi:hypothetical protein